MMESGAPPTEEQKYEFVHKLGRRDFNRGNSVRRMCDDRPLIDRTSPIDAELRIAFEQQVDMIRHHFHLNQL